jgi:hypothetical protein
VALCSTYTLFFSTPLSQQHGTHPVPPPPFATNFIHGSCIVIDYFLSPLVFSDHAILSRKTITELLELREKEREIEKEAERDASVFLVPPIIGIFADAAALAF